MRQTLQILQSSVRDFGAVNEDPLEVAQILDERQPRIGRLPSAPHAVESAQSRKLCQPVIGFRGGVIDIRDKIITQKFPQP